MRVNPYIEPLLQHAIDLLNQPPASAVDLERSWRGRGMPIDGPVTQQDVTTVRTFLRQWADVVDATDQADRVALLNDLLRRYTAPLSITDHAGAGWHLHYRDEHASFGQTLAGSTSASAAQFLCDRGMHRLGRCAVPECGKAFLDSSRPGTQRYCSPACANRDAVRRHRTAHPTSHQAPHSEPIATR